MVSIPACHGRLLSTKISRKHKQILFAAKNVDARTEAGDFPPFPNHSAPAFFP